MILAGRLALLKIDNRRLSEARRLVLRVEVGAKPGFHDMYGESRKKDIVDFLKIPVGNVRIKRIYTLDLQLSAAELALVARELFVNPVTEEERRIEKEEFDWVIEVGYKPGVTDNVGHTAKVAIEDLLGRRLQTGEAVYTSTQYLLAGEISREQAWRIGKELLANEVIENVLVLSHLKVMEKGLQVRPPSVQVTQATHVNEYDLNVDDEELIRISRNGVLALSLDEMKTLKEFFNNPGTIAKRTALGLPRNPTDVEIEMLAQTWSEHCKHKIFNGRILYEDKEAAQTEVIEGLFKTYIKKATDEAAKKINWLVSVFEDNAGVVSFNEHLNVVAKVETHNSPSALEPYGGAMTGIVGVNRDPLGTGKGASPMFNLFAYGFGNPFYEKRMPEKMLHPRRIRDGVHKGVIDGGNQSGIALARGREVYDPRYGEIGGKPIVYCGTIGTMQREILGEGSEIKHVQPGDFIVMVGGRIGKDGIHGATFASEELHKGSPTQAVQIGDPIMQKKMTDLLLEARDLGLYRGITDNGAGGLSSSVGEMAKLSGGCEVWLERAPLKYEGLDPWEILLSEAQERMTLAVDPSNLDSFLSLAEKREVEATALGKFTDSGVFHAKYAEKTVAYLDMEFLHEGLPRKNLRAIWRRRLYEEPNLPEPDNFNAVLKEMLGRLNICSIEKKLRQYDHEVKGLSIVKLLVGKERDTPNDATISLLEYGSSEALIMADGICPHYSDIDAYHMAQSAMDEAVRRIIAAGGKLPDQDHMFCVLDNFSWCDPEPSETNPDASYKMAQLVRACKGLCEYATYFGIPFISGKDSMKNDSIIEGKRVSIPPTLLVTSLAKLEDIQKTVTMDLKRAGDLVYILGETSNELGASEYLRYLGEKEQGASYLGNRVPKVDLEKAKSLYKALSTAIEKGIVQSAHTPTLGGLGVALAQVAFAGMLGLDLDLSKIPRKEVNQDSEVLFSESNSRFIVTVSDPNRKEFEEYLAGISFALVGRVTEEQRLKIQGLAGNLLIDCDLTEMKEAWKATLRRI